jgi:hypothetical protein
VLPVGLGRRCKMMLRRRMLREQKKLLELYQR